MKNILRSILAGLILIGAVEAHPQFLPSYTWVTNSSSGTMQSAGVTITNFGYGSLPTHSLTILNINTNQTFVLTYSYAIAGSTNITGYNTITTNFTALSGFTNGQTAIIPIPAVNNPVYFVPWGTFNCGAGYSNQVQFQ
jgi:hypothetical protein